MKLMKINVNTITIGLIIAGMILSLSLHAKGISYCTSFPAGAIARQQEEERREREQREQLNKLLNERIEQGKTIEITTDKNVKLLIKQRKMVDTTINNENLSLTECILGGIGIIMVCRLPLLATIIIKRLG